MGGGVPLIENDFAGFLATVFGNFFECPQIVIFQNRTDGEMSNLTLAAKISGRGFPDVLFTSMIVWSCPKRHFKPGVSNIHCAFSIDFNHTDHRPNIIMKNKGLDPGRK